MRPLAYDSRPTDPEPDRDVWLVQMKSGELRAMTLEELDRAYQCDGIGESNLVLSYDGFHWVTLGELVGVKVDVADAPRPSRVLASPRIQKKRAVAWTLLFAVLGASLGALLAQAAPRRISTQPIPGRSSFSLPVGESSVPPSPPEGQPTAGAGSEGRSVDRTIRKANRKRWQRRATPRRPKRRRGVPFRANGAPHDPLDPSL